MTQIPLPSVQRLVRALMRLPGIGPRTAQRLAMHILQMPIDAVRQLTETIRSARENVRLCVECFAMAESERCAICTDPRRDETVICVVENPFNVWAIERTGTYRGRYHVLLGVLSPLQGVGPEDLTISALLQRLRRGSVREVILALNPTVEGEATSVYLAQQIRPLGIRVTRPASGLPMGTDIEYVDELTLSRAFQGRQEI